MPQGGDLAWISQSGAMAASFVEWAAKRSVGFSTIASLGDQLDVDFADLLAISPLTATSRGRGLRKSGELSVPDLTK
jgi:hypothetical protein